MSGSMKYRALAFSSEMIKSFAMASTHETANSVSNADVISGFHDGSTVCFSGSQTINFAAKSWSTGLNIDHGKNDFAVHTRFRLTLGWQSLLCTADTGCPELALVLKLCLHSRLAEINSKQLKRARQIHNKK
jgi:hypothetical protein